MSNRSCFKKTMRRLKNIPIILIIGITIYLVINIRMRYKKTEQIANILKSARTKVRQDTLNYNFSQPGIDRLEDLVMETGGQPHRILIISTWRSGSSFLGELLYHAVPSTYYIFEPLRNMKQFNWLSIVKRMLQCNIEENYLADILNLQQLQQHFKIGQNNILYFNTEDHSNLCKIFPFLIMKLVRLELRLIEELLDDAALNMKVVLLIRDPRGVMQSRNHVAFCKLSRKCWDSAQLCDGMVSDYEAAGRILQRHPDKLMVMRFEELALQTDKISDRILEFLKVQRTRKLDEFLLNHTNADVGIEHSLSIFRVSHNVPFKWATKLDFDYVNRLQITCSEAMRLWGYKMAHNETHMKSKDFNPVAECHLSQSDVIENV